jgi:hypothetical protein
LNLTFEETIILHSRLAWTGLVGSSLCLSACGHAPVGAVNARLNGPSASRAAIVHSAPIAIPSLLRDKLGAAQHLMVKPLAFKSPEELEAYLGSVAQALPQKAYDPDGWLAKLGMADALSPGREDAATLAVVRQLRGYKPGTLVNGKEILPQVIAFDFAMAHPQFFLDIISVTNPGVEALSIERGLWKETLYSNQKIIPTMEPAGKHYAGTFAKVSKPASTYGLLFDDDVHSGVPTANEPNALSYGTYSIARNLGFTDDQARRIALSCDGIDYNTTPYGGTSFSPTGQMDRHFNLDRKAEDTRLVWSQKHLKVATEFGHVGSFDQAEVEIGCGLHSLQDAFAHGQLTPSMHGVIGEFPDQITYDPIAFYEATAATSAYLKLYVASLDVPAHPLLP